MDNAIQLVESEELAVREKLSKEIGSWARDMLENCTKIGELDIAMAKVIYARNHDCTIPKIADEHIIEFKSGRYIPVEDVLLSKSSKYCPIDVSLAEGVTCITGANMGGKTVSLKLVGLVTLLTQNAFFVPCKEAVVGLSNFVQILIGDNQSLERGLSSFGSEMEELKEILDNAKYRSLLMIDEIASGTNPKEGFALTKSFVKYLKNKPYITLLTTHFDGVSTYDDVNNLQVVGLANVNFDKLNEKLRKADKSMRVNIIAELMDYRLRIVKNEKEVPKDAINIAKMLGIKDEIINDAKKYS
jgi:dsDNA-specific endonuclease/ATPase MutS2